MNFETLCRKSYSFALIIINAKHAVLVDDVREFGSNDFGGQTFTFILFKSKIFALLSQNIGC